MNLTTMLPHLKGWKFDIQLPVAHVIPAGQFVQTFHSTEIKKPMSGFMLGMGVIANSPLLQLQAIHWGPKWQERNVTVTSFALNASGLTGYWNPTGFASIYNAVAGIYSIAYMPDSKIGSWDQELRLRLINGTGGTITVSSYSHTLVLVMDEKAWKNSIHKFLQSNIFHVKGLKKKVKE